MATRRRRKNQGVLVWLRAAGVALATFAGLNAMHFRPGWGVAALALIAGVLTLAGTDLGVLAAIVALALPMIAASPVVGLTFLILGVVMIRYLGSDGGQVFFIMLAGILGAFVGPAWAAVALAGYVMGAGEGAMAAAMACVTLEAVGLLMGKASIGATITGGTKATALLSFAKTPDSMFAFEWIKQSFGGLDADAVNKVIGAVGSLEHGALLVAQPILWGVGAGIAGMLATSGRENGRKLVMLSGAVAGPLIVAAGTFAMVPALGAKLAAVQVILAAIGSAVIALGIGWAWDRMFPWEHVAAPSRLGSMASEDADVDELLRLISTAEERLSTEHTTTRVVMITDMKSFSKMTEEDGSVLTAKAIQKHRDLLLPVVEKHGGHGKSTGGDGLVASFVEPEQAVAASAEMQRVLFRYNADHPDEREMTVRIGIADGEVVLDKGGRPFIGAALNLAARIMNLADGGQTFATAAIVSKAKDAAKTHSHGDFELKNIAKPIEVFEVLWSDDQQPMSPKDRLAS